MSVRMRQFVERQIITSVLEKLIAAGYRISVDNGEDTEIVASADINAIMKVMFQTDDETLFVHRRGRVVVAPTNEQQLPNDGWVQLIYGNSGYDVVHDYTTNLRKHLKQADKLADYWSKDGPWVAFK